MLYGIFQNSIRALCKPGDRILAAVSGGKDSMALLHLLHHSGCNVSVAHANFGLRGSESDADEELVRHFCLLHEIHFFHQSFKTKTYAKQNKISVQMAARDLRYAWFNTLAAEQAFDWIATAHHLSDNLETVLLNFARGTGPRGLTGIPLQNGKIIRPLLAATAGQIAEYVEIHNVPWREDASNREDHYHRNRIRHRIVPQLKTINPGLEETFATTVQRFQELEQLFSESLAKFLQTHEADEHGIRIPHTIGASTSPLLWEEFLKPYGFRRNDAETISQTKETGKRLLSSTHMLLREREHWLLCPLSEDPAIPEVQVIHGEGKYGFSEGCLKLNLHSSEGLAPDFSQPNRAWIDADKVAWPLELRPWRKGDRFIPFGMKGSKLVADYLKDAKISSAKKAFQWVVADTKGIVWLVGLRTAHPYRLTPKTQNALLLEFHSK